MSIRRERVALRTAANFYGAVRQRSPGLPDLPKSCREEAVDKIRREIPAEFQPNFDQYIVACQNIESEEKELDGLLEAGGGLIGANWGELRTIEKERKIASDDLTLLMNAFEKAKKAYEEAVEGKDPITGIAGTLSKKEKETKITDTAKKLEEALEKIGQKGGEGAIAALEEREKAVMGVLNYLASTNANAALPTNTVAGAIVSFLPALKAAGNKILTPQVSHLLLIQEHQRLERDQIARTIERQTVHLSLLIQQQDALTRELKYLNKAIRWVELAGAAPGDKSLTQWVRTQPATPEGRAISSAIVSALFDYAISWTAARVPQEEIEYKIIALRHEAALDASDFALQRWNNLIGIPLKQLEAYHAAGIKPETVANLLSAAGITAAIGAK